MRDKKKITSNLILMLTAAIWGLAFVAQRVGARFMGAFTFNGLRFMLGAASLLPLVLIASRKNRGKGSSTIHQGWPLGPGLITGGVLFLAASLQQIGMSGTTAGKAAFITGLYIVMVPLLGLGLNNRVGVTTWLGAAMATAGLYVLTVTEKFAVSQGDGFELAGSVLWAVHILLIDGFSKRVDGLQLSLIQFLTCAGLSLVAGGIWETTTLFQIRQALIPLLYGGIFSVGIAYTLQVIGQKHAPPSVAAIILSLEAVFASLGGGLILHERLGVRGYIGCGLMLLGMILSQMNFGMRRDQKIP